MKALYLLKARFFFLWTFLLCVVCRPDSAWAKPGIPAGDPPQGGDRIAFASNQDGNFEIYVMNSDGSGTTRLTDHPEIDMSPAWSPEGSRIAFVSSRGGSLSIYLMNADGSGVSQLTNDKGDDHFPAWSPDGKQIVFASKRAGTSEIYHDQIGFRG